MSLPLFPSSWMNDEHRMLQDSVARFFKERWVPRAAEWREGGMMGRDTWLEAGANGLLCTGIPEAYRAPTACCAPASPRPMAAAVATSATRR